MKRVNQSTMMDAPETRFNWGYWDGRNLGAGILRMRATTGTTAETHYDPHYVAGVRKALAEKGIRICNQVVANK